MKKVMVEEFEIQRYCIKICFVSPICGVFPFDESKKTIIFFFTNPRILKIKKTKLNLS